MFYAAKLNKLSIKQYFYDKKMHTFGFYEQYFVFHFKKTAIF